MTDERTSKKRKRVKEETEAEEKEPTPKKAKHQKHKKKTEKTETKAETKAEKEKEKEKEKLAWCYSTTGQEEYVATKQDLWYIIDALQTLYREYPDDSAAWCWRKIPEICQARKSGYLRAVLCSGKIAGFLVLTPPSTDPPEDYMDQHGLERAVEISTFVVFREYRRIGLASSILRAIVREADRNTCLQVFSLRSGTAASGFWSSPAAKACGFAFDHKSDRYLSRGQAV